MNNSCNTSSYECCLYFTANSFSRFINEMADEAFKITGLAPSYAYLMLLLIKEPGLTQTSLSQKMNLKVSTMTRFIDKLVQKQYVLRTQKGRTVLVEVTEKGKELQPKINEALMILYKKYSKTLGEEFTTKLTQDIHEANLLMNKEG